MSTNNLNTMSSKTTLEHDTEVKTTGFEAHNSKLSMDRLQMQEDCNGALHSNSPEIICSPSPCVFDSNCKNSGKIFVNTEWLKLEMQKSDGIFSYMPMHVIAVCLYIDNK